MRLRTSAGKGQNGSLLQNTLSSAQNITPPVTAVLGRRQGILFSLWNHWFLGGPWDKQSGGEALVLQADGSVGFSSCHSSPEKVDSGLPRELEETGAVKMQETLSSQSPIGVDWVKAFQNSVKQL